MAMNERGGNDHAPDRASSALNGGAGLLVRFPARALLWAFTIVERQVAAIDLIADPEKLRGLPRPTSTGR